MIYLSVDKLPELEHLSSEQRHAVWMAFSSLPQFAFRFWTMFPVCVSLVVIGYFVDFAIGTFTAGNYSSTRVWCDAIVIMFTAWVVYLNLVRKGLRAYLKSPAFSLPTAPEVSSPKVPDTAHDHQNPKPAQKSKPTTMKPLGILLIAIGAFLMYQYYETSQTFAFRLNTVIGNDSVTRGIAYEGIGGVIMAIIGCLLVGKSSDKSN